MTPTELRAHLKNPPAKGNREELLHTMCGAMSEEEADDFERRINETNERVDEESAPLL